MPWRWRELTSVHVRSPSAAGIRGGDGEAGNRPQIAGMQRGRGNPREETGGLGMGTERARDPMFEQSPWLVGRVRERVFYVWGPDASGCKWGEACTCAHACSHGCAVECDSSRLLTSHWEEIFHFYFLCMDFVGKWMPVSWPTPCSVPS
jgi:hypothetical protein